MPKDHLIPVPLCIIGDGYSAAALLLQMKSVCGTGWFNPDQIAVVGPGQLGAGQAFGCVADAFRLNVRAELMQLWPDRPHDFAEWAASHIDDTDADTNVGKFYRRRDFANYINEQLDQHGIHSGITHHRQRAMKLAQTDDGWLVTLDDNSEFVAGTVVLTTGNPHPSWPCKISAPIDSPTLVRSPWRGDWISAVDKSHHVTIIGGGLTAMDTVHSLDLQGHLGPVTIVTPHGMLPPVQTGWKNATDPGWPSRPTALTFLRQIRKTVGAGDWREDQWQEQFEGQRIGISGAWMQMTAKDQSRLMRRLGWLWSLARFRAGPQAHASVARMNAEGQVKIIADRAIGITQDGNAHRIALKARANQDIICDVIVNCSGAGRDALVTQLLENGKVARHLAVPSRADMTDNLCLKRPDGTPFDSLFAIGPMTSHVTGDILGAASIARQARMLAPVMVNTITSDSAGFKQREIV